MAVLSGTKKMPKLLAKGDAELDGGVLGLAKFGRLFDRFSPNFEIVTP
jgi:alkyl sulfatase BDS1-like metallo-beta-lactamase superfamily hydrolase